MTEKEMLKRLLENNFFIQEGGLSWSWKEMYTLKDEDPELNDILLTWLSENNITPK